MERLMAIDYGTKRIGVAISDVLGITARGLETIKNKEMDLTIACNRLIELLREYSISKLIVGLPKRTDGNEGESADKVRKFVDLLLASIDFELDIEYKDERFTSTIANRLLNQSNRKGSMEKRKVVDQIAAEIILQDYLDYRSKN